MRFLDSADRHGIARADALHVVRHALVRVALRDEPPKELFLGFDRGARALEVVVTEIRGRPFLIHAMRLRRSYRHLLEDR